MGISAGTDISAPPGYLWSQFYSNVLPWIAAAYGVSLGTAVIAGDEDEARSSTSSRSRSPEARLR